MSNCNDFEQEIKQRPHVVLLGAGASVATIPNGDKYGKKISVMSGFIEKLGMSDTIKNVNLSTQSDNLEDIYSELDERDDCLEVKKELEHKIENYFLEYKLPDSPTIYDFLILSLTKKDLVATFNWDPLLVEAYRRAQSITNNLPKLVFLHGNVAIGVCAKDRTCGPIDGICSKCKKRYSKVPLLYPVKQKDYSSNIFIKDSWTTLENFLNVAYRVTIFGYSAPKSDESAIEMLKQAWGNFKNRNLEEIEIIDIRDEEELKNSWTDFIHTHHYSVHKSFFESSLGKFPRRTCETLFDSTMNCCWLDDDKGFKEYMSALDIRVYLERHLRDEKNSPKILKNFYKIKM